MPLPESIAVTYTEEDAGYVDVQPVIKQSFQLRELLDLVLSVTGKDSARIQQILRAGTVVYHFYRYRWIGFETAAGEVDTLLAHFPSDDPSRPFRAEDCNAVVLESIAPLGRQVHISKEAGERKRFFRSGNFWKALLATTTKVNPKYLKYSYSLRADLFQTEITNDEFNELSNQAKRLAVTEFRKKWAQLKSPVRLVFVCLR